VARKQQRGAERRRALERVELLADRVRGVAPLDELWRRRVREIGGDQPPRASVEERDLVDRVSGDRHDTPVPRAGERVARLEDAVRHGGPLTAVAGGQAACDEFEVALRHALAQRAAAALARRHVGVARRVGRSVRAAPAQQRPAGGRDQVGRERSVVRVGVGEHERADVGAGDGGGGQAGLERGEVRAAVDEQPSVSAADQVGVDRADLAEADG
jgi:hypothetical protein